MDNLLFNNYLYNQDVIQNNCLHYTKPNMKIVNKYEHSIIIGNIFPVNYWSSYALCMS